MIEDSSAASRLTQADRALIQSLGNRLRLIIQNKDVEPIDVDRRDELGILANMVNRVVKELRLSRRRDEHQRAELEQRVAELNKAYETQQQLLATIKELSTPILSIYEHVLLLPMIGTLDTARTQHMIGTLLAQITARQARVVILDITGVPVVDTQVANVLLQAAQATALLGAQTLLCGITPAVAQVVVTLGVDLAALTPCSDLQAAIERALQIAGRDGTTHRYASRAS